MMLGALCKRIVDDLRQKELMPLKLLFFIHASTLFVLYPYLTIHMRELGIDVEETAIMNAVIPFIAIIMPPLAGMVADRIGNFRILLSFFSAVGGVASLLLLLVPVGRFSIPYPDLVPLGFGCGELYPNKISPLQVNLLSDPPCAVIPRINASVELALETCGLVCSTAPERVLRLMQAPVYRVDVSFNGRVDQQWYAPRRFGVESRSVNDEDKTDPRELIINFPQHYNETIRQIASNQLFFPTPNMFNVTCSLNACYFTNDNASFRNATESTTTTFFSKRYKLEGIHHHHQNTNASHSANKNSPPLAALESQGHHLSKRNSVTTKPDISGGDASNNYSELEPIVSNAAMFELRNDKTNESLRCENPLASRNIGVFMPISNTTLRSCRPLCLATTHRRHLCKNLKRERIYDPAFTFWCYLAVRVLLGVIGGTAFAMFEGAVIATLREYRADYGLQRIYATIGGMISSPLAGMLIDYASRGREYTNFRPAFYLYAALKVVGGLLMLLIRLDFKAPAPGVVRDMIRVLRNVELVVLLLACFLLGSAWGYLESFLFWLLQDLGGSRSLMGLTITVGGLAGLPLLALSGPIIDALGHANVICIGFVFYAIRLLGYSLLYNPWMCLLFEAMEGVTSSLTFTAVVTYGARLSNSSTDSSIQGLLGGVYYGVGKGAGSLIGGFLIKAIGARPTYQTFAVASAVFAVIYFLFHKFVTLRRPQRKVNDIMKPREEKPADPEKNHEARLGNGKTPTVLNDSSSTVPEIPLTSTNAGFEPDDEVQPQQTSQTTIENHKDLVEKNDVKSQQS